MSTPTLTEIRHALHRHAELSGEEEATAALLAEQLSHCRPDNLMTGLGGHGVCAEFQSGNPGPTVLLRADIDALPLSDLDNLGYASQTAGVAHKCGHDGHMTMLLGLARRLADAPPAAGRVLLLFQPAEETGAGAKRILADPRFADLRPDRVLGLHNLPGFPLGSLVVRNGSFAAASRGLEVTLTGASSHAAEPEAGRSPAPAAAALVQALTNLPQLEAGLAQGAKATVVGIDVGGPAYGTSPGRGRVMVTLRAFTDPVMDRLSRRAVDLATGLAAAHGLDVDLAWHEDFPATLNDPDTVAMVADAADGAGIKVIRPDQPFAWSEDFGHFTAAFTGALVGLGAGEDQPPLHHPDYDFPDALLETGVQFWHRSLAALLAAAAPDQGGKA